MPTPNDVLRIAAGEIGYYAPNDPEPGSKYGRWLAQRLNQSWLAGPSVKIWWCQIFVSWVFDQAGVSFSGGLSYNTNNTLAAGRREGRALANVRDAQPGDIVFYDWGHDGATDHVGIIELNRGNTIQTIEGNTSSGAAGSQSAGNGVYRRVRNWSAVAGVIRPYFDNVPAADSAPTLLKEDSSFGTESTKKFQAFHGTTTDGVVSSQPATSRVYNPNFYTLVYTFGEAKGSKVIEADQRYLNSKGKYNGKYDGFNGPGTNLARAQHLSDLGLYKLGDDDDHFGPGEAIALQRALNRGIY